ncbi:MAG TPA: hybrid sensor histidine kinase/response regulator, partial [Stenotrophomonas sp.]|nr:hybrid sensor histidine kinase/response regulator [Stenotrophomonas sp.]
PGMSGLDMLKELRVMQAGGGPRTPVLVLSADVTPEAIQRCTQAGAHAFLAKPVVAVRLLDTLAEIANNAQLKTMAAPVVRPMALQDGVLDSSVLDELASLGMGEGFEREFIRQCLEDVASCMGKAEQSGEAAQWDVFREQSHAIKGVASNLGLMRASNRAGELMRMADWQLKTEWRPRLGILQEAIKEGRRALEARAERRVRGAADDGEAR